MIFKLAEELTTKVDFIKHFVLALAKFIIIYQFIYWFDFFI